jgi:large subunit ribosomal protein L24
MAMSKIKIGDRVVVIAGSDKQKIGKVFKKVGGQHLLIEGVRLVKKNVRSNPQKNEKGGIVEREAAIHVSNVAIYNDRTKKADRVGIKEIGDKENRKRVRYFKSDNELIDV